MEYQTKAKTKTKLKHHFQKRMIIYTKHTERHSKNYNEISRIWGGTYLHHSIEWYASYCKRTMCKPDHRKQALASPTTLASWHEQHQHAKYSHTCCHQKHTLNIHWPERQNDIISAAPFKSASPIKHPYDLAELWIHRRRCANTQLGKVQCTTMGKSELQTWTQTTSSHDASQK